MYKSDRYKRTPFAVSRLNRLFSSNALNEEQEFTLEGSNYMSNLCEKYTNKDGDRILAKMLLKIFRQCLVTHFDIRFKRKISHGQLELINRNNTGVLPSLFFI